MVTTAAVTALTVQTTWAVLAWTHRAPVPGGTSIPLEAPVMMSNGHARKPWLHDSALYGGGTQAPIATRKKHHALRHLLYQGGHKTASSPAVSYAHTSHSLSEALAGEAMYWVAAPCVPVALRHKPCVLEEVLSCIKQRKITDWWQVCHMGWWVTDGPATGKPAPIGASMASQSLKMCIDYHASFR